MFYRIIRAGVGVFRLLGLTSFRVSKFGHNHSFPSCAFRLEWMAAFRDTILHYFVWIKNKWINEWIYIYIYMAIDPKSSYLHFARTHLPPAFGLKKGKIRAHNLCARNGVFSFFCVWATCPPPFTTCIGPFWAAFFPGTPFYRSNIDIPWPE